MNYLEYSISLFQNNRSKNYLNTLNMSYYDKLTNTLKIE